MAKQKAKGKKRKIKRRGRAAAAAGGGVMTAALGNVLGNMVGQLMADGVGAFTSKKATETGVDDVAAQLLKVLSERGPQSIADLIDATKAGLTPVLKALHNVRDFRLVDFIGEGDLVQLTAAGNRTVTVIQKDDIRKDAAKLLQG